MPDPVILVENTRLGSVALAPSEAALGAASGLVDLVPSWEAGHYTLTARSLVGRVSLGQRSLIVRPKLPLSNVFAMLAWTAGLPSVDLDLDTYASGEPVLAGLADLYAERLDALLQRGLARQAASMTEPSPFVRGKLLLGPTLRQSPARRHRPITRRSQWQTDILPNQLLKQAARVALAVEPAAPARRRLDHALAQLADVADTQHPETMFDRLPLTRQETAAVSARALARWLIAGATPTLDPGGRPFPVFRLDLARLFERFIAALLLARLPVGQVAVQRTIPLDQGEQIALRPDIIIEPESQAVLPLDTKYKSPTPIDPADIYQLLTYCQALGARRGALVYPVRLDNPPLVTRAGGLSLAWLGLDLGAPPDQFTAECDEFVARVQAALVG